MGGIGTEAGVRRGVFGGNGNMGGFCLGLGDLEFWRWGSGKRLREVGFLGVEEVWWIRRLWCGVYFWWEKGVF